MVEFATYNDMKNALEKLDDTEINGRRIRLYKDKARDRRRLVNICKKNRYFGILMTTVINMIELSCFKARVVPFPCSYFWFSVPLLALQNIPVTSGNRSLIVGYPVFLSVRNRTVNVAKSLLNLLELIECLQDR